MSERGRDPQPWDDDLLDESAIQRKLLFLRDWNEEPYEPYVSWWEAPNDKALLNVWGDARAAGWTDSQRTRWLSFAWACVYVLAAGVVRAVGRAARAVLPRSE